MVGAMEGSASVSASVRVPPGSSPITFHHRHQDSLFEAPRGCFIVRPVGCYIDMYCNNNFRGCVLLSDIGARTSCERHESEAVERERERERER